MKTGIPAPIRSITAPEVFALLGGLLVSVGFGLIFLPLALIIAGVFLVVGSIQYMRVTADESEKANTEALTEWAS